MVSGLLGVEIAFDRRPRDASGLAGRGCGIHDLMI
jgi:hypothetical protein